MDVIFEFLGKEPIENVITCMNYQIDKVVYWGYQDMINNFQHSMDKFLKKYCAVKSVEFCPVPQNDLQIVLNLIKEKIEIELENNNNIYFDITGGESLILVAFGIVSAEYKTAIHNFDIEKNQIFEFADDDKKISKMAKQRKNHFTVESYIELQGGIVDDKLKKDMKTMSLHEEEDMKRMWSVAKKNWEKWNYFSVFMREKFELGKELSICKKTSEMQNALFTSTSKIKTTSELNKILNELKNAGILLNVVYNNQEYKFTFKNQFVKNVIWDGGSILELQMYQREKKKTSACCIGVHIDWDGITNSTNKPDVINEIDVLSVQGNIPTFISCKSGKIDGDKTLTALYELETIAKKFGGKYARKVLVVTKELSKAHQARAEEMGIEIINEGTKSSK